MFIRQATQADLPAMVEVVLAALAADSSWQTLLPAGFAKDPAYAQFAHDALARHIAPSPDAQAFVAEVPGASPAIASVAVWDMSRGGAGESTGTNTNTPWRRSSASTVDSLEDLLPGSPFSGTDEHNVYDDSITAGLAALDGARHHLAETRHLANLGPYAFLEVLATHPAHRGRGLAKALCKAGTAAARARGLSVAVLTGSRGYIFFSGMAFADLGCISLGTGAEPQSPRQQAQSQQKDECVLKVMVLHAPAGKPRAERRRSSVIGGLLSWAHHK